MRYIVFFLIFFVSLNAFCGDTLIIKYKDGSVQKIQLKGRLEDISSIEFVSFERNLKKNYKKKESTKIDNKRFESGEKYRGNEKGDFAILEKQMKERLKPTFEGMWKTNFGNLIIKIKGNKVFGLYKNGNGRIEGTLLKDGYVIEGKWSEAPDFKAPQHAGRFYFKLSETGSSFKGKWGFGDEEPDSEWVGRKIK